MAKIKMFSGQKRCLDGERYNFRKGIATVPGILFSGKPIKISINEFRELCKETNNDD